MRRPMLVLALAFGVGAGVGEGLSPDGAAFLFGAAFAAIVLAPLADRIPIGAAGLVAAALGLGAANAAIARIAYESAPLRSLARLELDGPLRIEGVAREDARARDALSVFELEAERVGETGTAGRVRVVVAGDATAIVAGDRLALWLTLRPPAGFVDPGVPDAVARARREGWHASGYCKSTRLVEKRGRASGLRAWAGALRARLRQRLQRFVPEGPEQAIVRAMVLGDRGGLEKDTEDAFRIAGTYHVLALSGAQVALVAALLLWPLRAVGLAPWARATLVSAALGGYGLLVGGDVPIVRAALMAVAVLLGKAIDLDGDTANLLGLSALVSLVARPGDWADLGFQLSYAATLGLVVLTPGLVALLPKWPLRLELALATSCAAQLALMPLLLLHFHRLAPAALALNLVAVPLSTAVLVAGVGVLAASCLSTPLATGVGLVAFAAARGLLLSGTVVSGVPLLDARLPDPPVLALVLHILGLVLLARGRRRLALLGFGTAWSVAVFAWHAGPGADGRLHLCALDVGQGDALVLRSPRGRLLVVDAGGGFDARLDIGERVLGPYLWSQGVLRVDTLALSHAHPDHVGGVPFLLAAFRVGEVWEGLAPRRDRTYEATDRALRSARVARRALIRGASLDWDGVRIDVLGPPGQAPPLATRNDDSLVLRLTFGEVSLLLAGDVELRGEAALRAGPISILKVAHHGSRTSTGAAFLSEARPRVAIVSAGRGNPFGHPHPEVAARLLESGALLFRTDREGAIELTTDGHRIVVASSRLGPVRVQ